MSIDSIQRNMLSIALNIYVFPFKINCQSTLLEDWLYASCITYCYKLYVVRFNLVFCALLICLSLVSVLCAKNAFRCFA